MERVLEKTTLGRILGLCEEQEVTDLHGQVGGPLWIRAHGRLRKLPADVFQAATNIEVYSLLSDNFSAKTLALIEARQEYDMSFQFREQRYRANFSKQKGLQSFSFRLVPRHTLTLEDLQLPESLADIMTEPRGLVLVTGPTGQGKSTTLRALIQQINESLAMRIITIEDPIEYVFKDALSNFEQREVGIDTASFADGIRNAMRQDPDVIFVGEIRDRESIFAAMQAAETGHLVLTTLHADSVAQAISRIREYYPSTEQDNISSLLGRNIRAIVCQRLLPNTRGARTPCLEILKRDPGVREAIAENNLELLEGIVEASVNQGMHTFDQYLMELFIEGVVTEQTVRQYAVNPHAFDMKLRGIQTQLPILKPERNR